MLFGATAAGAAVGAVTGAVISFACVRQEIRANRRTARQRETLDFLKRYNSDERISSGHAVLRMNGAADEILKNKENLDNFLFLMNEFEILAIGLKNEIYDEAIVLDAMGRDISAIYQKSEMLIKYRRKNVSAPAAFLEFEKLAGKVETNTRMR